MFTFEEQVNTPFGVIAVRLQGACDGLRLVRRSVDQAGLDLRADERADHVELVQAFTDLGALLQDRVSLAVHYDWPAQTDGDEGTQSLNFHVSNGGVSLAVLDSQDLERRRGVTLVDRNAELNALFQKEKITLLEAERRGLIPPYKPLSSPVLLDIAVSPPGGFLTVAIAWKQAERFSHDTDFSVYAAAERAALELG
jgi:hypothetical protein